MEEAAEMEAVESWAVQVFIINGFTPKETFDEMNETYGESAPPYDVVKY